jgi:hypothetical protein
MATPQFVAFAQGVVIEAHHECMANASASGGWQMAWLLGNRVIAGARCAVAELTPFFIG